MAMIGWGQPITYCLGCIRMTCESRQELSLCLYRWTVPMPALCRTNQSEVVFVILFFYLLTDLFLQDHQRQEAGRGARKAGREGAGSGVRQRAGHHRQVPAQEEVRRQGPAVQHRAGSGRGGRHLPANWQVRRAAHEAHRIEV